MYETLVYTHSLHVKVGPAIMHGSVGGRDLYGCSLQCWDYLRLWTSQSIRGVLREARIDPIRRDGRGRGGRVLISLVHTQWHLVETSGLC